MVIKDRGLPATKCCPHECLFSLARTIKDDCSSRVPFHMDTAFDPDGDVGIYVRLVMASFPNTGPKTLVSKMRNGLLLKAVV